MARSIFDSNNLGRLKLFGAVLSRMQLDDSGRIATVYVDQRLATDCGGTYDDTEGLINLPLTVKEILAVVFFKENGPGDWRISMRSKGDDRRQCGGQAIRRRRPQERLGLQRHRRCPIAPPVRRQADRRHRHGAAQSGFLNPGHATARGRRPRHRQAAWATSHDVVAAARRILRQPRIGHAGTLDPLATGVLLLACGRATRLARFLQLRTRTTTPRFASA